MTLEYFCEVEFEEYIRRELRSPQIKALYKNCEPTQEDIASIENQINDQLANMGAMELVCYLGEYLTNWER